MSLAEIYPRTLEKMHEKRVKDSDVDSQMRESLEKIGKSKLIQLATNYVLRVISNNRDIIGMTNVAINAHNHLDRWTLNKLKERYKENLQTLKEIGLDTTQQERDYRKALKGELY